MDRKRVARELLAIAGEIGVAERCRRAAVVFPFVVNAKGKMKPNIVAAENEQQAEEIFDYVYPRFALADKSIVRIVKPELLY